MNRFEGKVAVITGAGSGIGRALALNLAKRGARLALSDIDTEGLAETVRQAEALGADVKSDRLNVAERETVLAYADAVVAPLRQSQPGLTTMPASTTTATSRRPASRTSNGSWTSTSMASSTAPKPFCRI